MRVLKLNELLDTVSDKMIERFEKRPDEFSHRDLMDYMTVISTTIDKAQKNLQQVDDIPQINYNQNNQININIADTDFSRESRDKITDAVQAILKKIDSVQIDEVIDDTKKN